MKTVSLTIERNYRIDNFDQYAKARFSIEVAPDDDDEDTEYIAMKAIDQLNAIFRKAYPHVEEQLNFHVERQVEKDDFFGLTNGVHNIIHKAYQPAEKTNIPTIEEPYDIYKEMDSCKSLTVLKIYEKQCKTAAQKAAYEKKVKELEQKTQTA